MRIVRYVTGRKSGMGYGWQRLSDGGAIPFKVRSLDELKGADTYRTTTGDALPVIEMCAEAPDRWLISQYMKIDQRVGAAGERQSIPPYQFTQRLFLDGANMRDVRPFALALPQLAAQRGWYISVAEYQSISEDASSEYTTLDTDGLDFALPEYRAAGEYAMPDEARLAVLMWRTSWARLAAPDERRDPIRVIVTSPDDSAQTLYKGLDFVAGRLNKLLPDPVKAILSVAIGVPPSAESQYAGNAVLILYNEPQSAGANAAFDMTGTSPIIVNSGLLTPAELALADMLYKGQWPAVYSSAAEITDDAGILCDYNFILTCVGAELALASPIGDTSAAAAAFSRINGLRSGLIRKGLERDAVETAFSDTELRFLSAVKGLWPAAQQLTQAQLRGLRAENSNVADAYFEAAECAADPLTNMITLLNATASISAPAFGQKAGDITRLSSEFGRLEAAAKASGLVPDDTQLGAITRAAQPYVNESGAEQLRAAMGSLLTRTAEAHGVIPECALTFAQYDVYSPDELSRLLSVGTGFISCGEWSVDPDAATALSRLAERYPDEVKRAVADTLHSAMSRQTAGGNTDAAQIGRILDFIRSCGIELPDHTLGLAELISACPDAFDATLIKRLSEYASGADSAILYDAALSHLDRQAGNAVTVGEYESWLNAARRRGWDSAALTQRIRQRATVSENGFKLNDEEFARLDGLNASWMDPDERDRTLLGYWSQGGSNSMPILTRADEIIRRSIKGEFKLPQECIGRPVVRDRIRRNLRNMFDDEFAKCRSLDDINAMPKKAQWLSGEAYNAVYAADSAPHVLINEHTIDALIRSALPDRISKDNPLPGAAALVRRLNETGTAYPQLTAPLTQAVQNHVGERADLYIDRYIGACDDAALRSAYDTLVEMADAMGVDAIKTRINALEWLDKFMAARTPDELTPLAQPGADTISALSNHMTRIAKCYCSSLMPAQSRYNDMRYGGLLTVAGLAGEDRRYAAFIELLKECGIYSDDDTAMLISYISRLTSALGIGDKAKWLSFSKEKLSSGWQALEKQLSPVAGKAGLMDMLLHAR